MDNDPTDNRPRNALIRVGTAFVMAIAFAFGAYLLLEVTRPTTGVISFSFLLILPAALSAFIAYVSDPWGERSMSFYLLVPVWLLCAVIVGSIFILKEGTICIVLLSPLWLISGMIGTIITYRLRHRNSDDADIDRMRCVTLIAIPFIAMQVEPMIPLPEDQAVVTRSIIVDAAPSEIWPLLRGIPDVSPNEGRWNVTQDVLGVPRPLGARLVGEGIGAVRLASWGDRIRFREEIIAWEPGRQLRWRFKFDDLDGWRFTDRHLMPNSAYFHIVTGGYRMDQLGPRRTRVTLDTRYRIITPVNSYSELWGQFVLGDVENNLLALVKQRAERTPRLS